MVSCNGINYCGERVGANGNQGDGKDMLYVQPAQVNCLLFQPRHTTSVNIASMSEPSRLVPEKTPSQRSESLGLGIPG